MCAPILIRTFGHTRVALVDGNPVLDFRRLGAGREQDFTPMQETFFAHRFAMLRYHRLCRQQVTADIRPKTIGLHRAGARKLTAIRGRLGRFSNSLTARRDFFSRSSLIVKRRSRVSPRE